MPPERRPADDPRAWLDRARSNLVQARLISGSDGVFAEDVGFQAQQAAEKAVKGLLVALGVDFPLTHDLAQLLSLAERGGQRVPRAVRDAARLTRYAVAARYPGAGEPVSPDEADRACSTAEGVVEWVEETLK